MQKQITSEDVQRRLRQRFERGANQLINCHVCGKRTHSRMRGITGLDMCATCLTAAELEIVHFDGGHRAEPVKGCEHCEEQS